MKKRKLEAGGWSDQDKEKIAAHLTKRLSGLKLTPVPDGLVGTAALTAPLTTTEFINLLKTAGAHLHSCDFDLSALTLQFQFGPSPSELLPQVWEKQLVQPQRLPAGQTEDQYRIAALSQYAKTYLGVLTPSEVVVTVCDSKMNPVEKKEEDAKQPEEYKLLIKGWREATLEQLTTFIEMFPFHVTEVQVTGQQYEFILTLLGSLTPKQSVWSRLFGGV